jgi:hypothetical protein
MTTEQMVLKFVFDLTLLLAGLAGGAVALWTWQKGYWEYQLRRQTEDWKLRQSYSRKDARRQAMEGLLTELNGAVERHLIATYHTVSAIVRQKLHMENHAPDEEGRSQWQEMVNEQVMAFNESEREWLVQSAVLEGKLRLHFAGTDSAVLQRWPTLADHVIDFCQLLNDKNTDALIGLIVKLRHDKDTLLQELQREIDRFTASELEVGPPPEQPG